MCATAVLATILGFAYGATFANGCSEAAPAGAVLGCGEFILYRYQTLIGIAGALVAAWLTARPVWRQLGEIARQNSLAGLTHLRARSIELNNEEILIGILIRSITHMMLALRMLKHLWGPTGLMTQNSADYVKKSEREMNDAIAAFGHNIGPRWGTPDIQNARNSCRENARGLSDELGKYTNFVHQGNRFSQSDSDRLLARLDPFRVTVFADAEILLKANRAEQDKIGLQIGLLEAALFSN